MTKVVTYNVHLIIGSINIVFLEALSLFKAAEKYIKSI